MFPLSLLLVCAAQAQQAGPSPEAVKNCKRRLAPLQEDYNFHYKILPVWAKVRFHAPMDQVEDAWNRQCESGAGDGKSTTEDWLQRDARDAYFSDKEDLARRVLATAPGDDAPLELGKVPQEDREDFLQLIPKAGDDGDFRDPGLAASVGRRQQEIRSAARAARENLLSARAAGGGNGSTSPAGDKHPGQIVYIDKVENRSTVLKASEVPQSIAWVQSEGAWVPVVRIEITGTKDHQEVTSYGPDGHVLARTILSPPH
jgi:hypothetical protein